jgi:hypothetical protein
VPGLEHHTTQFNSPPEDIPLGDIELEIALHDPFWYYLPRYATINVPRDFRSENDQHSNSLFQPIKVAMYCSPQYPVVANWSGIRVSLWCNLYNSGKQQPIAGALLRVMRKEDDKLLASGLSDKRGEALVVVPGIPITNFNTEEINTPKTVVRLEVVVNPQLPWPVDPDALEANRDLWWCNKDPELLIDLYTGSVETVTIEVDMSE